MLGRWETRCRPLVDIEIFRKSRLQENEIYKAEFCKERSFYKGEIYKGDFCSSKIIKTSSTNSGKVYHPYIAFLRS